MTQEITTERLVLRPIAVADAPFIVHLNSFEAVRQYLLMPNPSVLHEVTEKLEKTVAERAARPDFGFWIARSESGPIGWFHLKAPTTKGTELGYRLLPSAWGRGFATEGGRALIERSFGYLRMDRVFATTLADNLRSRRVMERLGMSLAEEYLHLDIHPAVEYEIRNTSDEPTSNG